MDLRPKLADAILKALFEDSPDLPPEKMGVWKDLIIENLVSHSIACDEARCWVSCEHEPTIQAFRAKYPELEPQIEAAKKGALERWPEAGFSFSVHSDPEASHIIHEGQSLTLHIQTGLAFDGTGDPIEDGPFWKAHEEWRDWWGDQRFERDELFSVDLRWHEEVEDDT